jgi:hypothetical protein
VEDLVRQVPLVKEVWMEELVQLGKLELLEPMVALVLQVLAVVMAELVLLDHKVLQDELEPQEIEVQLESQGPLVYKDFLVSLEELVLLV